MFIEDEHTKVGLVVERVSGNREAVSFTISSPEPSTSRTRPSEVTCRRNQAGDAIAKLMAQFLASGSAASATFHIYFRSQPGTDHLRERWERVLSDPSSSEFRRRVAKRGLANIASTGGENERSGS
jgi:hypothetical protein